MTLERSFLNSKIRFTLPATLASVSGNTVFDPDSGGKMSQLK